MHENFIDFSEENIDQELARMDKIILVDFWNESCVTCKRLVPVLEGLASKFKDKLVFASVNVDRNPEIVKRFEVKGLPTLLLIKAGRVLEKITGLHTRSELIELIEKNF